MASPKRWTRLRWSRVTACSAVLLAVTGAAGCTASSAASTSTGTGASASAGSATAPAVTRAQASEIFGSALDADPASAGYRYGRPAYWLPEAAGYPRFFVADVTRAPVSASPAGAPAGGASPAGTAAARIAGVTVPASGRALLVFDQASATASWQLASTSVLPPGTTPPRLATDARGYVPQVPLSAGPLLARPDVTGPLQAAVVDDGPASAAMRVVAAGPLTTGVYQAARDHAEGLTAPPGDVYQWELEGTPFPAFALRTASGGALVLYTMYLNSTVAVPGIINKATPVVAGPPITVPPAYASFLPAGQAAPTESLEIQDLLSFAAVDPPGPAGAPASTNGAPASTAGKVAVIAIGGGPDYATAR